MNYFDYRAVVYSDSGIVLCIEHFPLTTSDDSGPITIGLDHEDVTPMFSGSEWDYYPSCDVCGREHDYIALTEDGRKYERRQHLTRMIRARALVR